MEGPSADCYRVTIANPFARVNTARVYNPARMTEPPSSQNSGALREASAELIAARRESVKSGLSSWLRPVAGVVITLAIFAWMSKPIIGNWNSFKSHVFEISWGRLVVASVMFASFLFIFRALSWWRILVGFGHRLPIAPTVRIWSTSELARYLPGVIWQVVGRAYLVRPYGVSSGVCSASQILELVIFLLANVMMAITCLLWNGTKHLHGAARGWMFCAMALVPILFFLVHPRVFYTLLNRIMRRLKKPPIVHQMPFRTLLWLLVWAMLGLMWQSLAIWVITAGPLGLQFTKWWVVAGAYSLAWCAGFLSVWAPGGIGVRELVFVTAMRLVVPAPVRERFNNPAALVGFLAFLSVLLRLWVTAGELILAAAAYALDAKGALGQSDAPGRTTPEKSRSMSTTARSLSATSDRSPEPSPH